MWISRKKYNNLMAGSAALLESLEQLKGAAILTGIERTGRVNTFTFMRNGEKYTIETMGLISDDLPGWKKDLLR